MKLKKIVLLGIAFLILTAAHSFALVIGEGTLEWNFGSLTPTGYQFQGYNGGYGSFVYWDGNGSSYSVPSGYGLGSQGEYYNSSLYSIGNNQFQATWDSNHTSSFSFSLLSQDHDMEPRIYNQIRAYAFFPNSTEFPNISADYYFKGSADWSIEKPSNFGLGLYASILYYNRATGSIQLYYNTTANAILGISDPAMPYFVMLDENYNLRPTIEIGGTKVLPALSAGSNYDPESGFWILEYSFYGEGWDHYGPNQQQPIPEPASMLLIGSGLIGLAGLRRKFKK